MVFTSGDICLSSEKLLHWTIRKLFSLGNSPMLHSLLVRCGVSFVSSTNIVPLHLLCCMHALWSRRNRHHFADGIFNFFSNEIFCIKNTVSSRFVLYGWIDNNSTFVLKMPWPWTGNKSLPQPVVALSPDASLSLGCVKIIFAIMKIVWGMF